MGMLVGLPSAHAPSSEPRAFLGDCAGENTDCETSQAFFVNGFVQNNYVTPSYILILFIASVVALAWAIFSLFIYHRSRANGMFVAIIDLGFLGAIVAGVYYLRFIANTDCTYVFGSDQYYIISSIVWSISGNDLDVSNNKVCAMLKACFALGIMNCIFFLITAVLSGLHGCRMRSADDRRYRRETQHNRQERRHSGSRHGSRRSSHSRHHVYG